MNDISTTGKVITFYSFKGGTGRTMCLANMGCWLAQQHSPSRQRVLLLDWDLEAPGLSKYFAAKAEAEENAQRPGLINYFHDYEALLQNEPDLLAELTGEEGANILNDKLPLSPYLIEDVVEGVDLLKAGRLDDDYRSLINTFNWASFFERYPGAVEAFRRMLTTQYAYSLVDSRTGFTDVSGICTMILPEKLVLVFTPNRQSLSGVIDVAQWATTYRRTSDDLRPLALFPLPSRIENSELKLKEEWREKYQFEFEKLFREIYQLEQCDLNSYLNSVQLPHFGFYSYGENLAILEEKTADRLSLRQAYESFFEQLITLDTPWEINVIDIPTIINTYSVTLKSEPVTVKEDETIDVFISYVQDDDEAFGKAGWVALLHGHLEVRLSQLLGKPPRILRDIHIVRNSQWDDQVSSVLKRSTVMLCVVTPRYLHSQQANFELSQFQKILPKPITDQSNVFKVIKTPISFAEQPAGLQETLGYEFYEMDPVTGRFREFDQAISYTGERDKRYWAKLDDLAQDIASYLRSAAGNHAALSAPTKSSTRVVYLAETTKDLAEARSSLARELTQYNFIVLPDKPLPLDAPALQDYVRSQIRRADLSIHLIGERYGIVPESEERSITAIQYDLAFEPVWGGLPKVVWLPPGLEPRDERQRQFIEAIRNNDSASDNDELIESKLEDLKTIIQRKFAKLAAPDASPVTGTTTPSIYLICDQRDLEAIEPIYSHLYDEGFEVLLPSFDEQAIRDHKHNLGYCDAVLFYYGQANELWLRTQIQELMKAPGYGRAKPFLAKAIYVTAPETPQKKLFQTREAQVIKNFESFDPATLANFLQSLRGVAQ